MDIKERFENYESKPDAKVWKGIAKQMRHRKAMRRVTVASVAVVAMIVASWAFWPRQQRLAFVEQTPVAPAATKPNIQSATPDTLANNRPLPEKERRSGASQAKQKMEDILSPTTVSQPVNVSAASQSLATPQFSPIPQATIAASTPVEKLDQATVVLPDQSLAKESAKEPLPVSKETRQASKRNESTEETDVMVWVPNAFIPESSDNDKLRSFKAYTKEGAQISHFKMYVYNRAGTLVFHGTSIDQPWDGTYRGVQCPSGSYVYVVEYRDAIKGIQHIKGTVTLIR
ncbi:MAG: gliding motility-associated C-terminal domain-containing protein [Bacteroidales bacterium]|nr:gliding motility-associated C-terminal domain-containing protein [Bacteroidales bacterium]